MITLAALAFTAAINVQYLTVPTDTQNPGGITMTFTPHGTVLNLPLQDGHPESGYITMPQQSGAADIGGTVTPRYSMPAGGTD